MVPDTEGNKAEMLNVHRFLLVLTKMSSRWQWYNILKILNIPECFTSEWLIVCYMNFLLEKTRSHKAPMPCQGCLLPERCQAVPGAAWNMNPSQLGAQATNECLSSQPFIWFQPATCQVALVVLASRGLELPCSSLFITLMRVWARLEALGCVEGQWVRMHTVLKKSGWRTQLCPQLDLYYPASQLSWAWIFSPYCEDYITSLMSFNTQKLSVLQHLAYHDPGLLLVVIEKRNGLAPHCCREISPFQRSSDHIAALLKPHRPSPEPSSSSRWKQSLSTCLQGATWPWRPCHGFDFILSLKSICQPHSWAAGLLPASASVCISHSCNLKASSCFSLFKCHPSHQILPILALLS